MASKNMLLHVITLLALLLAPQTEPYKPSSVTFPVRQDNATGLFLVDIPRTTSLNPATFLLDFNAKFLSVNCNASRGYLSSAYHYPQCKSKPCNLTGVHFCRRCSSLGLAGDKPVVGACHKTTCFVLLTNPLTNKTALADVTQDTLAVTPLQGSIPGPLSVLHDFIFTCAPSTFFHGLPKAAKGFAGFNNEPVSLPNQITSRFGFAPGFSLCLSSRKYQSGGIFFGKSPYGTTLFKYTPFSAGWDGEYVLPPVTAIRISRKNVRFNTSLSHDAPGKSFSGGTKISTTVPYMALEHTIFQAVSRAFVNEFKKMGASVAVPVKPFGACFNKLPPSAYELRFSTPVIEFLMQDRSHNVISWRVLGPNSLIEVRKGKWCLAFVDGGINPRASVVLGAYQLQDRILEFDFNRSRLGFSETIGCPQYNLN